MATTTIEGRDSAELKRTAAALAANEATLRQFITHAPAAIAMLDTDLRCLQTSQRWAKDYRLEGRNLVGLSHYDVFPDTPLRWREMHQRVLAGAVERCDEDPFLREDGATEWLQWEARPWRKAGGEIGGRIFFTQVITERKKAEARLRESLRESLREKEVMLREIHHRVKNNLAVISSLFHRQAGYVTDDPTLQLLHEAQARVCSIALVHEHLYHSDDLAAVNFGDYAQTLAMQIFKSYQLPTSAIALRTCSAAVSLTVDQASPCGLILNELISNCLKHAFQGRRCGEVKLILKQQDNVCVLRLADNGVGMPEGHDLREATSLGLRLVLTRQLNGSVTYCSRGQGTEVRLAFPVHSGPAKAS